MITGCLQQKNGYYYVLLYSVLSAWDSNLTVMRLFFCLHPSRCSRAAERMNNENT